MGVPMNLHAQGNPFQITGDGSEIHFYLGNNIDLDHPGTVLIYLDGVLKTVTVDYTISGYLVTFGAAPAAGVVVSGDYSTLDRQ